MQIEKLRKRWFPIKDYVVIVLGLALFSLGWTGFLIPNQITTGGVTGISAVIFYATKIPIAFTYAAINLSLLVFAIRILGWTFCVRTIFGVAVTTLFLTTFQLVIKEPLVSGQPFMSAVIGAMMSGAGVGMVFTSNGSTGGTDIIAAIVNKYRNISIGRTLLLCDVLIIGSTYLIFHNLENVVYGLVVMAVMTYTCDLVINGARRSVQFLIFSEKHEEIANGIIHEVNRGVTLLDGTGGYSKGPKKVIVVLAKRSEAVSIFRLVKSIDSNAFISQSNVVGVYGEGFDKIK